MDTIRRYTNARTGAETRLRIIAKLHIKITQQVNSKQSINTVLIALRRIMIVLYSGRGNFLQLGTEVWVKAFLKEPAVGSLTLSTKLSLL